MVVIPVYYIFIFATLVVIFWPRSSGSDAYGLGELMSFCVKLVICLSLWLLYFIFGR